MPGRTTQVDAALRGVARILLFPIFLCSALEGFFRRTSGDDWCRAGFHVATGLVGGVALWLYALPTRSPIATAVKAAVAWLLGLLGLLWFLGGGFWALALIPILRQGAKLKTAPIEAPEPDWTKRPLWFRLERLDYIGLACIGVMASVLLLSWNNLTPIPPDSYYHIAIARMILEQGAIPTWDDTFYAPIGRPHLYPPVFHILIAALSLPFGGDVFAGYNLIHALLAPMVVLTAWYVARWLFDARRAFASMLISGAAFDMMGHAYMTTPSTLATNLSLLALVTFLARRVVLTALLSVVMLYLHSGIPPLFLLGLGLFSLHRREYLRQYLFILALSLTCYSPWAFRMLAHAEWFTQQQNPRQFGVLAYMPDVVLRICWLLSVNVVYILLAARALSMVSWREARNQALVAQIAAMSLMFLNYGGRFFMHTGQIWSMFIAVPFVRFLDPPVKRKTIAIFLLLAFAPCLIFTGPDDGAAGMAASPLGFSPMFSPWIMPVLGLIDVRSHIPGMPNFYTVAKEISAYVEERTTPDQIVHSFGDIDLGIKIAVIAHRRMSYAAWEEIQGPPTAMQALERFRRSDTGGIFLTKNETECALAPSNIQWTNMHGIYVGLPGDATLPRDDNQ
ncbi:MAG: hypothetical protein AAB353_10790 [Candidatus Hydrogenedentota bacterium]|mgnify:CR=1 FL=1